MKCPTCGKPTNWKDNPFRPFCSERCKLVDFGRWVNEEYRVPDQRAPSDHADAYPPTEDDESEI
jgi:uncharacterized protein